MAVADHVIKEKREQRAALHAEYTGIVQKAATEKRGFTADEQTRMAAIETDMASVKAFIQSEERARSWEKELEATPEPAFKPGEEQRGNGDAAKYQAEYRQHFNAFLKGDGSALVRAQEVRGRYIEALPVEQRSLTAANPTQAGYLYAPEQFNTELIKTADNLFPLSSRVRKFAINEGVSMGNPKRTARLGRMTKGSEVGTAPENTALTFGKRELKPNPYSDMLKVSRTLMMNAPNTDQILRDEIAYAYGWTREYEILNGTGLGGPLGVFVASSDGISTARDVSTDNTTTAITYKGLVNAKFSLNQAYRRNASWLFHRDTVAACMKLLDSQNLPIFVASPRVGELDTVLNCPVLESEDAPNTFTTGLYVGAIADWSYYWLAEAGNIEVRVANELYMATNQVGYFYRMAMDGQPVVEEAFARVKLA